MEKSYKYGKDIFMSFIDIRQAYDNIDYDELWIALEKFGTLNKVICLIKGCDMYTLCQVDFRNSIA